MPPAEEQFDDFAPDTVTRTFTPNPTLEIQKGAFRDRVQEYEMQLIREALERCGWNRTKAAKYLNIPRHVLMYRMKKYAVVEDRSNKK